MHARLALVPGQVRQHRQTSDALIVKIRGAQKLCSVHPSQSIRSTREVNKGRANSGITGFFTPRSLESHGLNVGGQHYGAVRVTELRLAEVLGQAEAE